MSWRAWRLCRTFPAPDRDLQAVQMVSFYNISLLKLTYIHHYSYQDINILFYKCVILCGASFHRNWLYIALPLYVSRPVEVTVELTHHTAMAFGTLTATQCYVNATHSLPPLACQGVTLCQYLPCNPDLYAQPEDHLLSC